MLVNEDFQGHNDMFIEVGDIVPSKYCGDMQILEDSGWNKVVVKFTGTGFIKKNLQRSHVLAGQVKDPYYPSIYGTGYLGEGVYKSSKHSQIYSVWSGMLKRAYSKAYQDKNPTYVGCTVCEDWHSFQNFAQWYEENRIEGLDMDKDKKIPGNLLYSPDTVTFISRAENSLLARESQKRRK